MTRLGSVRRLLSVGLVLVALHAGCAAQLEPAGEAAVGEEADALTASPALVGQRVRVTASALNLRSGPGTGYGVLTSLTSGVVVTVEAVSGGWLRTTFQGTRGWLSATYVELATGSAGGGTTGGSSGGGGASDPSSSGGSARDQGLARARSGVGFSYKWGGSAWSPGSPAKGACFGNCPDCSHSGQWGADCSGFVSKVWQVPGPVALTTSSHPFTTRNFRWQTPYWKQVSRSNLKPGDALVQDSGGAGHIFIYESGDGWGWMKSYEARGCSAGIIHASRTAGSGYVGIARNGW
jgi:cell wall-associated NlpC family hydrolase